MPVISVVICTFQRPAELARLLGCLATQLGAEYDVLVVDATSDDVSVEQVVEEFCSNGGNWRELRYVRGPRGLTRQRNLGLREVNGDAVAFFDDDVTFDPEFLAGASAFLAADQGETVGGITAYEPVLYGKAIPLRYRIYRRAGLFRTLRPGSIGRCHLPVPLQYAQPGEDLDVEWLPGFCMIYRSSAVEGRAFDEQLRTYSGEDVDFSESVGAKSRLVLCSNLIVRHHETLNLRSSALRAWYEVAYGVAVRHLKRSRGLSGIPPLLWYAAVDLAVDSSWLVRHPSRRNLATLFAKPAGLASGIWHARRHRSSTSRQR